MLSESANLVFKVCTLINFFSGQDSVRAIHTCFDDACGNRKIMFSLLETETAIPKQIIPAYKGARKKLLGEKRLA